MLFVRPPRRLGVEEAEEWLRRELAPVVGAAHARSAALSRLDGASLPWSQEWGWLIELEFDTADDARGAVHEEPWSVLLGDLRLLGMSPSVALVDGAEDLRL
jgi:hypothetical protein